MPLNVDKISTGSLSINGTEITPNAPQPYKVYTALLTQNGGDSPATRFGDGEIVKGTYYLIDANPDNEDLTLVGAPNNNPGTYFVATETVDGAYTPNVVLLYNEGAPVVTVLENTIGNIVWTYEGTGQYSASVPNFVQEKVLIFYGAGTAGAKTYVVQAYVNNFSPFGVWIDTSDSITGLSADDVLQETPIEIRVYN